MQKPFLKYLYLISILLITILNTSISQTDVIKFNYYSVEHGLPESAITSIYQDEKGFMWFGTWFGLSKFDGYTFKNRMTKSDDWVNNIFKDKEGIMWVSTQRGLLKIDERNNIIKRYLADPSHRDSLLSNSIFSVFEDKYNNLWIGSPAGINIYNRKSDNFFQIQLNIQSPDNSGKNLSTLYLDNDGNIWIGANGGGLFIITSNRIRKFNDATQVEHLRVYSFKQGNSKNLKLSGNEISAIREDKNGILWIGTRYDGINCVNKNELFKAIDNDKSKINIKYIKANFLKKDKLGSNKIECFFEDRSGNFWVGTYGGGLHRYLGEDKFIRYVSNEQVTGSISNDFINCIYEDRSGLLWIGTSGGGVNRCYLNKIVFKVLNRSYTNPEDGLYENMIFSLVEDKNKNLWIGTRNGISSYNPNTKKFFHYSNNPKYTPGIRNDMTRSLCEDSSGNIWIGTAKYGLIKYNKNLNNFRSFVNSPNDPNSISANNVRALLCVDKDNLWIGTSNGLSIMNLKTENFTRYNFNKDSNSISSNYIYYSYKDKWKNIWIGTQNGLNLYNRQSNNFLRFYYKNKTEQNDVTTITSDDKGAIWFGTKQDGLFKLIPASYENNGKPIFNSYCKIVKLTDDPPLRNEFIYSILTDNLGKIWFGTNHGLWKLNPENKHLRRYDVNDGLLSNEFNTNAAFKSFDGTMYFGGLNGINIFTPHKMSEILSVPEIVITSIKIYDKEIKFDQGFENLQEVNLNYQDKYISIEFAALDYTDLDGNTFAYKLEGFDKDWIYCNKRRFASYTNLEGGDYIFRLKGATKDNVWNESRISVKIHVTPPFYKTLWFQLLSVLLIILAVFLIIKRKTQKLDRQNKLLELMVKQRTEEIRKSEEKYRNFVSQTTDGIVRFELVKPISILLPVEEQISMFLESAYIAESNEVLAKMFGCNNSGEITGKKVNEIIDVENEMNKLFINEFFNSNYKLFEGKIFINLANNELRCLSHNLIGIVDDNFLSHAWGILNDITEKLKLEEERSRLQTLESLKILIGGLSHDFRNLLTVIRGQTEILELKFKDEKTLKNTASINEAVKMASGLLEQLSNFAGKDITRKSKFPINNIINEISASTLSGSPITTEFIFKDSLLVEGDKEQISQVFTNLFMNASEAMPNGGQLFIETSDVKEHKKLYVKTVIKDSGIGIPKQNIRQIFNPYFSTKIRGKEKGSGLGLAVCHSIIKSHDGRIDVQSEENKGSTFIILLPAKEK